MDKPKLDQVITFRLDNQQYDELLAVVKREDRRLADVVRRIFLKALKAETRKLR
jgi:hypothetical protein